MLNTCVISGLECLMPVGWGWITGRVPVRLQPCAACGGLVCDRCSGNYWYMGAPRRLCVRCAVNIGAQEYRATSHCELCGELDEPISPYGGKMLCAACLGKLEAVRELCNQSPESMIAFVFAGRG